MDEARISGPEVHLWQAVLLNEVRAAKGQPLNTGYGQDREREIREARRWLCKGDDLWYVAALAGFDGDLVRRWAIQQQAEGWPPEDDRIRLNERLR